MNKNIRDAALANRAHFTHWTVVPIRFSDQDSLGHVNNVAIAAYVEAGRTALIHEFLLREKYPDLDYSLAHLEIDYLAEFHFPGTIDVGGRVEAGGRKILHHRLRAVFGRDLRRHIALRECVFRYGQTPKRHPARRRARAAGKGK